MKRSLFYRYNFPGNGGRGVDAIRVWERGRGGDGLSSLCGTFWFDVGFYSWLGTFDRMVPANIKVASRNLL